MIENSFKGKKVLITGNTGFKGSWLTVWLLNMEAQVYGISHGIPSRPSLFEELDLEEKITHYWNDIRDLDHLKTIFEEVKPDFLFHLAAQAIVGKSYTDPIETTSTNVMGTANILEALRTMGHSCTAVLITSDKSYDNLEWVWGYRENDRLGGKDPYSASKGSAELIIKTYAISYFSKSDCPVKIAVARAGNVIGGGDWAKDRIVPDCMSSWSRNETVSIRHPHATRPWQHVLEPLSGYLVLASVLSKNNHLNGEAFNFGPHAHNNFTVRELITTMSTYWKNIKWKTASTDPKGDYEAGLLKLCCDKALLILHWEPTLNFEETVQLTVDWYKYFYENQKENLFKFTNDQIQNYISLAENRGLKRVSSCSNQHE